MDSRHLMAVVERDLQVVTRSVYYYAKAHALAFNEIHVLTTRLGFENVMHRLLGPPDHPGNFDRLCAHLGLPRSSVKFDASCIHTLRHPGGRPIAAFREADDLVWLADQALGMARALVRGGDVELFVTGEPLRLGVAAGLATALQMLLQCPGRFCDICVHPLVAFEIERGRLDDFYYPLRAFSVGGVEIAAEEALVARELLFVAGRPRHLPSDIDSLAATLAAQARLSRWLAAPDPMLFDLASRELRVGDAVVPLAPVQFFWYAVLASRPGQRLRPDTVGPSGPDGSPPAEGPLASGPTAMDTMSRLYQAAFHKAEGLDDLLRLAAGSRGYLASVVSRLNSSLRSRVRPNAGPYLVRGGRKSGGYWLPLDPSLIRFAGLSPDANRRGAA